MSLFYWSVEECRWVECPPVAPREPEVEVPEPREAIEPVEPELVAQT